MASLSRKSKNSREVQSEINITPLVDVMLVLLIIFMISTPMMQQGIDIELPKTTETGIATNEDPLVLRIKRNKSIYISGRKVRMSKLRVKLKAILKTRKSKQIYIKADRRVNYGFVAKTMAEIRAAGLFNIGLVTVPSGRQ